MDDIDRKLMILLAENPRVHFQELAKRLGISRQAVHRRMRVLKEAGVMKGVHAYVSIQYLDAVPVAIYGISKTKSAEATMDRLGESDMTRRAIIAGGNYLYVVGILRDISDLDAYAEFVKRTAEMPEPLVGIYSGDEGLMAYPVDGSGKRKKSYKQLSPIDLRIIASLKDDARRPVAEIAEMLGISAKTVQRHLEDMISDGSLDMSTPADAQLGGDMLLIMHIELRDGVDKVAFGKKLLSKGHFQDQYVRTFSNLPGYLDWVFWSDKITEIRRVLLETSRDQSVASAMINFAIIERIYACWRDKMPEVQTRSSRHTGKGRASA